MRFTRSLLLIGLIALVVVPVALALRFTDASFNTPVGEVQEPYSHRFELEPGGGCGAPYEYVVLGGTFPPGLSLDRTSGKVTGTPTVAGDFTFNLEGRDMPTAACFAPGTPTPYPVSSTQRDFTIKIASALSVQQNSLAPIFVNAPYSFQLTASGGGTQTWSIQSGTLPPGITFSAAGLLSGTPSSVGISTFVVKVTDGPRVDTETLTLVVVEKLAATATAPAGEVGVPYSGTVAATGGKPPYRFEVTGGALPAGLSLNLDTGAITGVPTTPGLAAAVITAKDTLGLTAPIDLKIAIAARLAVRTALLKPGKEGKPYLAQLRTSGGVAPTTWRLVGTLPRGLRFNARLGAISGTPKQAGKFTLRFIVTDSLGAKANAKFQLIVTPKS